MGGVASSHGVLPVPAGNSGTLLLASTAGATYGIGSFLHTTQLLGA